MEAGLETLHAVSHRVDAAGDLVPRGVSLGHHAGVQQVQVAAADAAGLDAHPHLAGARLGDLSRPGRDPARPVDESGAHARHRPASVPRPLSGQVASSRSITARTTSGQAMVASAKTSAKRPPSAGGTNFPQETPSV